MQVKLARKLIQANTKEIVATVTVLLRKVGQKLLESNVHTHLRIMVMVSLRSLP